jgi:allantoinase
MIRETFETLHREGTNNGRLLALNLHPWLIGQPFRIGCLDTALGHIMRHGDVWAATGSEAIDWYSRNRTR